uniref:Cysteine-rich venom protein n=1 Tax=Conus textile TaxID=6494 RepID=TX31_CONTE|nr:RecName: Full=Cysteine-rich venom protein; Short=CRVP; AltName: Full=Substrate-specific endoprotease Tex31; Flags: Precursor [Conus textile]CAD36507.1 substrate-specific endoprotease [Conus textile]
MLSTMQTVGAVLMLSIVLVAGRKRHHCDSKYYELTPAHTMCLTDKPNAVAVPLTQETEHEILEMHNKIRADVTDAANMLKMEWDERLATVAQKWAMQCILGHDSGRRGEPDLPGSVGQNVAWSSGDLTFLGAVQMWADEIVDFQYGVWTDGTGHYIQQVFAGASRIGCGQSACGNNKYFVCNYYKGTMGDEPYQLGRPCSQCRSSCQHIRGSQGRWGSLCDCTNGPDACFNGGIFNINTCQCECSGIWGGADCQEKHCPNEDFDDMCRYPDALRRPQHWCQYDNFQSDCPILCGYCPNPN